LALAQDRGEISEIGDAVRSARFGQRNGKGYYRYKQGSPSPLPGPDMEKLITARLAKPTSIVEADVLHRLFGPAIIGSLARGGHRAELKTWLP
jgi:hypothetical protein